MQKQERTVGTIAFSTSEWISNFSKVLFWAAKASGTEWTVFNGTLMNVVELLIMTKKWPHHNDVALASRMKTWLPWRRTRGSLRSSSGPLEATPTTLL